MELNHYVTKKGCVLDYCKIYVLGMNARVMDILQQSVELPDAYLYDTGDCVNQTDAEVQILP